MEKGKKIQCFEYVLNKLTEWAKETDVNLSSLTVLKVQKLLFLLSAVNSDPNDSKGLLDIFDNFYAMRYGPVESDVYNSILNKKLQYFDFSSRYVCEKSNYENTQMSSEDSSTIDCSINSLKIKNNDLIKYSSTRLVEITHKWEAWKNANEIALALSKGSQKMTVESIILSNKYFD